LELGLRAHAKGAARTNPGGHVDGAVVADVHRDAAGAGVDVKGYRPGDLQGTVKRPVSTFSKVAGNQCKNEREGTKYIHSHALHSHLRRIQLLRMTRYE